MPDDIVAELRELAARRLAYEAGDTPFTPNASADMLDRAAEEIERLRAALKTS